MRRFQIDLVRTFKSVLLLAGLFACSIAGAAESAMLPARNLAAEATSAVQSGMPLIVLVSLAGCPHCEIVRRFHLLPLLDDKVAGPKPTIRQIEINGREKMRDFDGGEITQAEFVRRHKAKIAPVVFFFGANGESLAEPLVGSMIPEFYGAYFDAAINEAILKLRRARGSPNETR